MTSQTIKQTTEVELASRFLNDAGFQPINFTASDRPDIVFSINGRNIGMEVTVFHADEGNGRHANDGSLRQAGERNTRNAPGSSYVMSVPTDPHGALVERVNDKICRAAQYNLNTDELWLLVSAQQLSLGALPATYVISSFIDINKLNSDLHDNLSSSRFNCVYWHLIYDHAIYGWDKESRWHIVRQANPPDTSGMNALKMIRQRRSHD